MDELVRGQDYWINTMLGRPVKGLLNQPGNSGAQSEYLQAYESETIFHTLTQSDLDELRPYVVDDHILQIAQAQVYGPGTE